MLVDWIKLFRDRGVRFEGPNSRGFLLVKCPMPGCSDMEKHGGVSVQEGYYTCWKCGTHQIERVISRLLKVPHEEAQATIWAYSGRRSSLALLNKTEVARPQKIDLPGAEKLSIAERRYLKGRGFDPDELVVRYGLRSGGISGTWAWRVVIPFYLNGHVVTYQARDVTGNRKPRYMTLDKVKAVLDTKQTLYNIDNCTGSRVMLTEGVTDVWRLGNDTLATAGTEITSTQLKLLRDRFDEVVMVFDPEPKAQERAKRYAGQLALLGLKVEVIDLEMDRDPGELTLSEVKSVRRLAGLIA